MILVEDNTAVKCPEEAGERGWVFTLENPQDLKVKQNNVSFCRLFATVFHVESSNEVLITGNTIANDTTACIYFITSNLIKISNENIIEIDHIVEDYGLLYSTITSSSSISDSLFISISLKCLRENTQIALLNCLFYDCSFTTDPDIATIIANTKPFTNTNTHFGNYECLTPILKTSTFTYQIGAELKAFLTHFLIG